jgi:hypothetical protein
MVVWIGAAPYFTQRIRDGGLIYFRICHANPD